MTFASHTDDDDDDGIYHTSGSGTILNDENQTVHVDGNVYEAVLTSSDGLLCGANALILSLQH